MRSATEFSVMEYVRVTFDDTNGEKKLALGLLKVRCDPSQLNKSMTCDLLLQFRCVFFTH